MKRNQILIGVAAVLAVVLLWYFLLYKPLGEDLTSAQEQTASEQKKSDALEADLARLQSQAKNATQQQALLRKLDAAVPAQPNLAEFIIQANEIADQSGISFLAIAPSPPSAGTGGASEIKLTMSVSGSFFQLQDYLRQLETLERLVIVDGITIGSSPSTTGSTSSDGSTSSVDSSGGVSLSVTLTGRMFTRAAPTTGDGSSSGATSGTTTTTVPGATSSTTAPASGSTTGG